jgi:hypothetical protein
MKRNLILLTVLLSFGILFSACKKDEKTTTELLTYKKGWVLAEATSSPAYELADGSFATNLMTDGYLLECELDDVVIFADNGAQTIVPKTLCDFGYQGETAALWTLVEKNGKEYLKFQIPFFYDETFTTYDAELEECEILNITDEQLRIKFTFNDDANPAKGTYSFTLTYKHAK